jgi:hypothetical protein
MLVMKIAVIVEGVGKLQRGKWDQHQRHPNSD